MIFLPRALLVSESCKKFKSSIYTNNFIVVEDINKKREPLSTMEGVYLITPSEKSVRALMYDFEGARPMYKAAHVYFTEGNNC